MRDQEIVNDSNETNALYHQRTKTVCHEKVGVKKYKADVRQSKFDKTEIFSSVSQNL